MSLECLQVVWLCLDSSFPLASENVTLRIAPSVWAAQPEWMWTRFPFLPSFPFQESVSLLMYLPRSKGRRVSGDRTAEQRAPSLTPGPATSAPSEGLFKTQILRPYLIWFGISRAWAQKSMFSKVFKVILTQAKVWEAFFSRGTLCT